MNLRFDEIFLIDQDKAGLLKTFQTLKLNSPIQEICNTKINVSTHNFQPPALER